MADEPLDITLTGSLLEQVRAASQADGCSVEDWVRMKLEQRVQRDVEELRHSGRAKRDPESRGS